MLADTQRMASLLCKYTLNEDRSARLGDIFSQFARLSQQEGLKESLKDVFSNLEMK